MKWRSIIRVRKPWPLFFRQCLVILGLMIALGWWVSAHFEIGIAQGKPCMRGKFYFIKLDQEPKFRHGDLIVFRTDSRTAPFYQPGVKFVKAVRGVPGDHVKIDSAGKVTIESVTGGPQGDVLSGKGYHFESALEPQVVKLLTEKRKLSASIATDYLIPEGSFFVQGTLPDSYDSRYWGLVNSRQIFGRALVVVERESIDDVLAAFSTVYPALTALSQVIL